MTYALLQAGGRSQRMRHKSALPHKALVKIAGLSLLERNLIALCAAGFRQITAAVNEAESEVLYLLESRGREIVAACGDILNIHLETNGLGTIGAAKKCNAGDQPLLVVNVDNLMAMDLRSFVMHHTTTAAAMTIATHWEGFQMPFGEVIIDKGCITDIKEKPLKRYHTSSGTYVLSPKARAAIPQDSAIGAPDLFERLHCQGHMIAAYDHETPWIDINRPQDIERAEVLIAQYPDLFETPFTEVGQAQIALIVTRGNQLFCKPDGMPYHFDLPPNCDPIITAQETFTKLDGTWHELRALDHVDRNGVTRIHGVHCQVSDHPMGLPGSWMDRTQASELSQRLASIIPYQKPEVAYV